MQKKLILASTSPRRKELLAGLGLTFTVDPSHEDEMVAPGTSPKEIVELLARRKAESVAKRHDSGLVIGSDTIVVLGNEVLGKPEDAEDAYRMLSALQGKSHEVYTGIAIVDADAGDSSRLEAGKFSLGEIGEYRMLTPHVMVGHTVSKVVFGPMSDSEIWAYIETGAPLDKAGAYGIQGLGSMFIEKIEGDFYSVMGLPIRLLFRMLDASGVKVLG